MRVLLLSVLLLLGCQPPEPAGPSHDPAGVFAPLDGEWVGTFRVYVDTRGQRPGGPPETLDPARFAAPPFRLETEVSVRQVYTSLSPYLQRVEIHDRYTDAAGKPRESRSTGVNEVQGQRLFCVVHREDDTVVHTGTLRGDATIVWERYRRNPLARERFEETVRADRYSIVGWGYYGSDDPEQTPPRYFHAVYERPPAGR